MSNGTGYTPGPWFVAKKPPQWDRQPIMAKRTSGACGVADVYLPPYPEGGEANAHLIAAAPELYEALEDARRWLQGDKWRMSQIPEEVEAYLRLMGKVDSAIAKARGESDE